MSADPYSIALAFLRSWGGGIAALRNGIDHYFTDQTVWENVGLITLNGRQESRAFIDRFHETHGLNAITVEIIGILADDHRVMTERVDHLTRIDGSNIHSVRIMGAFDVAGSKIIAQRDYFCPLRPG